MQFDFELADTKNIRAREVYSMITLIAEVSGLADVFVITASFAFALLYTPYMCEIYL